MWNKVKRKNLYTNQLLIIILHITHILGFFTQAILGQIQNCWSYTIGSTVGNNDEIMKVCFYVYYVYTLYLFLCLSLNA